MKKKINVKKKCNFRENDLKIIYKYYLLIWKLNNMVIFLDKFRMLKYIFNEVGI